MNAFNSAPVQPRLRARVGVRFRNKVGVGVRVRVRVRATEATYRARTIIRVMAIAIGSYADSYYKLHEQP